MNSSPRNGLTRVGSLRGAEGRAERGLPPAALLVGARDAGVPPPGRHGGDPSERSAQPAEQLRRPRVARGDAGVPQRLPDGRGRVGRVVPGRAAQLRLHRGDRHRAADDRHLRQRVRPGVPAGASCARASRWASCCTVCGCRSAPLGLLYGAHCPPEIRVRIGNGAADAPASLPIRESGPVAGLALGLATLPADGSVPRPPIAHGPRRSRPPGFPCPTSRTARWPSTTRRTAPCSPAATPTSCGSPRRWTGRTRGS